MPRSSLFSGFRPFCFPTDACSRYRNLKAERRKEIKAREAAVRLAHRKSRGATIPEDADAHGREPPRLLILYGTQVQSPCKKSPLCFVQLCALIQLCCRRVTPGHLRWKCLKRHQNEVFLRLVWTWRCMLCNCSHSLSSLESLKSFAEMHAPRFA